MFYSIGFMFVNRRQIFPLPLSDLLALNDTVQIFSMELEGFRKCHGCGKKAASKSLNRCAKCASFWYCSRVCMTSVLFLRIANMDTGRLVSKPAGRRKVTSLSASFSRILTCEDLCCLSGRSFLTLFDFLFMLRNRDLRLLD